MKKFVVLVVMVLLSALSIPAFASEVKMIGTVTIIRMHDSSAEITLKDRKSDEMIVLHVSDFSNMEKLKDKKIRIGDELRIRFDSASKVINRIQKTAGC